MQVFFTEEQTSSDMDSFFSRDGFLCVTNVKDTRALNPIASSPVTVHYTDSSKQVISGSENNFISLEDLEEMEEETDNKIVVGETVNISVSIDSARIEPSEGA
jgi:hypothetical protein